jgi:signal transduction histidine kinase/DNA-binding response OmpR family regulator
MFRNSFLYVLFSFVLLSLVNLASASQVSIVHSEIQTSTPVIDLREKDFASKESFNLDGYWNTYWGSFIAPNEIATTQETPVKFPVPGVWNKNPYRFVEDQRAESMKGEFAEGPQVIYPPLGFATYHTKVLIPESKSPFYLYIPDMPSAYKLFINGKLSAQNGEPGLYHSTEVPQFRPKVIQVSSDSNELDIVIHISNHHYREGGIWFSLRIAGEAGRFDMEYRPIIFAVFFSAILIAIGLYNFSLFAFRTKELSALYFGLLCLAVGFRRLIIDERVLHLLDWFSWATLQRIEHLCFYLALPLFMGFFTGLYRKHVPAFTMRVSWILISPFVFICLIFENRIYTELNVAFQVLVLISVSYTLVLYLNILRHKSEKVKAFGASLLILALTVIHDVLKANGIVATPFNAAHFGILAFVIAQSIALQRTYLKSLDLVETMSVELRSRNKELLEMDEFKDEFLATTSHELRTPLQGISGLAKVLIDDENAQLNKEQRNKVELIANTSQRLSVLVNDILDFSSIKHGKLKLNLSSVDLNRLTELVLTTVRPLLANKAVELRTEIAPTIRHLNADEFRIQQILINILGNAVKYTDKGAITLSAYEVGDQILIKVSDTGVGIPKEKLNSLFRPFEQVHVEGHPTASGTGLGLSISKQLVELHGGTLNIDSELGKGTDVTISFPQEAVCDNESIEALPSVQDNETSIVKENTIAAMDQQTIVHDINLEEETEEHQPLIFIVDDEPVNLELVSSLISQQGYQYEVFPDGLSVLARLSERVPDLILLDFMMPKMSGIEVCTLVRKQYDAYELPIMMLTARHQIADIVSALSQGANDYLIKPYHNKELIARVESQLSVRKFWIASQENQKLRNEIIRREALEEELSELNSKLLNVLDISEELIIVVNEQLNIVYTNDRALQEFNHKGSDSSESSLLGQSISNFILPELLQQLKKALADKPTEAYSIDLEEANEESIWHASIKYVSESDQPYLALVINRQNSKEKANANHPDNALAALTMELSESRRKINEIEGALRHVLIAPEHNNEEANEDQDTSADDQTRPALEHASTPQISPSSEEDSKELIVSLLRTSLNLWERSTNKSKVDLAEQSRCWRVYVDGTTVKTRTFDKYLSIRTIPDRPRWRSVVRTANYVLANCELSEPDRQELSELTYRVENSYT